MYGWSRWKQLLVLRQLNELHNGPIKSSSALFIVLLIIPGENGSFWASCNKISIVQQMADNFHFKLVYLSAVNWNSRSSLFFCVCLRMFSRFCPHSIFWLNWTGSSRATPLGCKIHNHKEKEYYRKAFDLFLSLNRRQKRRRNIRFLTYAYVVWIRHRAVSYECIYEL